MRQATGDYEIDRQRHMRAMAARLPGEVEKMTWPLGRLHALRDQRLRALVRTAQQRSPWHARRLRHIDPDTLRGDDLTAIPPMTKDDLTTYWDEIVTDRRLSLALASAHLEQIADQGPAYLLDEYHVVASGGTSGRRIADVQGRQDDLFVYPGPVVVHPHVFRTALGRVPEIVEYQVRQTPQGAEVAVRAVGPVDFEPIRRELLQALAHLGLADPALSLTAVSALDRLPGTGKLKRFLPLANDDRPARESGSGAAG